MSTNTVKWWVVRITLIIITVSMAGIALAQTPESAQPVQVQGSSNDKIEQALVDQFAAGPADYIVRFKPQADLSAAYQMGWKERGQFVYNTLREAADASQAQAKGLLDGMSLRYKTFIAGNELYVWGGSLESAQALAALPEVDLIRETRVYHVDPVIRTAAARQGQNYISSMLKSYDVPAASSIVKTKTDAPTVFDWGITDTKADQFWYTFGFQGDGILVANIDTGVDYTHVALNPNYKCAANPSDPACWLDPGSLDCSGPDGGPCDAWPGVYHGTHVMGTMVAEDDPTLPYQVGMAPNAQWIACLGCPYGGCPDFDLNTCADWILAPGGNPDNRPNVVNNSWGDGPGNPFYMSQVQAWVAAGIFPAFSAGNGYSCSSLGSPGDYQESFGSASHREWDRLISDFSSKGPSVYGHDPYTKPNLSAPGENIMSTMPGDGWQTMSGTSMASPHTAGAVALLWSCNPGLVGQIDQTFQILQGTTDPAPDGDCGAPPDGEGNYTYGYGYLDVYSSGLQWCGEIGTLQGTVTDDSTGNPISLAHVFSTPGPFEATTNDAGFYQMTMMVGPYEVTAEAFGYFPATATVNIITDTVTLQDFALEPAPASIVSGTVTDSATGWPLYASIEIAGYPYNPVWSDPVTGFYQVSLPQGEEYEFTVNAWVPGYLPATRTVGPFFGDVTENFALDADLDACTAPGYQVGYAQNFEADNGGFNVYGYWGSPSWQWGEPYPYPGPGQAHSGSKVWATNLYGNYYDYEDSYLESPDIDLSSQAGQPVNFNWWQWLQTDYYIDYVEILASNDGGASWSTVYGPTSGTVDLQWTQHTVNLDPTFAVGNFRVRFHLYSNEYYNAPGWYIDDLSVGTCDPPADGGLVVGNVYDTNLGMPLTGAQVSNDSGESTTTVATADPNLGDSFYTLFSPAGLHDFTASYPGFNTITQSVDVLSGNTVLQDFYLPAGHLVADPDKLAETVLLGTSETVPLDLINDGDGSAYFEFREKDKGVEPAISKVGPFAAPQALVPEAQQQAKNTQGLGLPAPPEAAPLDAGDVFQTWSPTENDFAWGIAYDGEDETVWVGDGWAYENTIFEYLPDGTATGRSWPYEYGPTNGPADATFNWNTGMIWVAAVGDGDCIHEIDPSSGETGNTICPPVPMYAFRGLAYDPSTDTYFGGGWNDQSIYHFDADGTMLDSAYVGLNISGLAYNPETLHLFVMVNYYDEPVYVLDVANNYANVGQFYIDGWQQGYGNGAGLEIDCEGNLWAVAQYEQKVYEFDSGESASLCTFDVPWLSVSPITGTVPADSTQPVDVTFDATMLGQPGDYLADLVVKNDTPYGDLVVPVTMTVQPPDDWGKLEGMVESLGYCDAELNPLAEASILIEGSNGMTWTLMTDDTGYYSWWLDMDYNPYTVTVTYPEHADGLASGIMIDPDLTTVHDFTLRWLKPCLSVDPLSLEATLDFGQTVVQTIELTNDGGAGTPFEIKEKDRGFTPALQEAINNIEGIKQVAPRDRLDGFEANALSTRGVLADGGTQPFNQILGQGDVLKQWPTGLALPWGTNYDPDDDTVWFSNPGVAGGDDNDHEYDVDGNATGRLVLAQFGGVWAGDMAYNPNTGMMWQVNVGGDNCIYEVDPSDGMTGNSTCGSGWNWISQRGLAYDPETDTFFIGGWNDTTIYQFDGSGTTLNSWFTGLPISGLAYNSELDLLFIMENSSSDTISVFDVNSGSIIGSFTVSGFGNYVGAGLEIDCDGNLWAANQGSRDAYLVDSGYPSSLCVSDVPWLSEDPTAGSVPADSSQGVNVTFDASVVTQPGEYYADLKVKTDDPINGTIAVPVTMTVVPPDDWGKLTGVVSSLGYCDQNPSPLEDASVVVEIGGMPYTVTTGVDGAYTVWGPQGSITYTVSAEGHVVDSGTAEIVAGEITTLDLDLRWIAPCISGMDTSYDVEVPWHFSVNKPFEVVNAGAGAAEFELSDRAVKEITVSAGVFAAPQALVPEAQQQAKNTQGLDLPELPVAAPLDAGEVFQTWRPTENDFAWGIAYDGEDETVWVGDGWAYENKIFEYLPDGTVSGRSWPYEYGPTNGPADATFNWNTGMIWVAAVADGDCIHEIDPSSGETGNTICPPIPYAAFRGLAYDPSTDTYFGGGWNDQLIYHFDADGTMLDSAYVGLPISGLAYNPDTLHLFVMVNNYDEPVYVLDVANNYANVGQFYIDGWPGYWNGAGLEIDCEGNLWAVAQSEQKIYEFDSGETASVCRGGKDAPWLTEDPQAGSLLADDTFPIELTFTAFPSMSIGTYYTGTLLIKSTDPVSDTFTVPVTLTVIQPEIEMSLAPTMTAVSSPPGSTVQYRLTIQNNGNVPDTYDLSLVDDDWPTLMLTQEVSLDPGESAVITIFVFIPASAGDGEIDDFHVLAESSSDEVMGWDVSATADLSTRAFYNRIVRLTPATASMLGDVGEVMEYTVTLWNLSVVSDTIELHGEAGWEMDMSETSFTLDSFESAEVTVQVHIPWGAVPGELDTAMITATSQSDPSAWDETRLTTHAGEMHLFLPMVVNEP